MRAADHAERSTRTIVRHARRATRRRPRTQLLPDAIRRQRCRRRPGRPHPARSQRPERPFAGTVCGWRSTAEGRRAQRGADCRAAAAANLRPKGRAVMTTLSGVWLPIVTPFRDGAIDFASYESLLDRYLELGVSGIFPLGTTGEAPTLDDDEIDAIVERTLGIVAGRVPVFVGVGSNATAKVLKTLKRLDRYDFPGIVSVCPYYNRPSQDGLREHF